MGLSLKTGTEPFRSGSQVLQATVLDYWRWSGSDLMSNRERSILGEFLVATALGLEKESHIEWNVYDLKTSLGLKIEIKASSAKQSWSQSKPSPIRFDIRSIRSPAVVVATGSGGTASHFMGLTPELRPSLGNNLFVFALPE